MLLQVFASLGQRCDTLVQLVVLNDLILPGVGDNSITLVLGIRVLSQDVIMIGSEDPRYGLYIMNEIPSLTLVRLAGVLRCDHSRMIENRVHHEGFLLPILLCAGLGDSCRLGEVLVKLMGITAHLSRFYNPSKILVLTQIKHLRLYAWCP
jgi:hypothetical protein